MLNKLSFGGKEYRDSSAGTDLLTQAGAYVGDSLPADTLSVDTLSATVLDFDLQPRPAAAGGVLVAAGAALTVAQRTDIPLTAAAEYGAPVEYRHRGALVGRFALESATRSGKYLYTLSCVSAVGLLLSSDSCGGIYTGESAAQVIAQIIGGAIRYTLDETLGAVPVYGWLPWASRRDSLRDVLFAIGGQIRKDTAGELHIVPMTTEEPYRIAAEEMYIGGSVTGGTPATGVRVTEHSYAALPGDKTEELYSGEVASGQVITPLGRVVNGAVVSFDAPMHDLAAENTEIVERGANYAVLAPSPSAVLRGKQYAHTTRVIALATKKSGTPNVLTCEACTLVNLANSELVARRLLAYYGSGETVETDLVVTTQKPGDQVQFDDPFGAAKAGIITSMELTMSAKLKGRTTIVTGYTPVESGNYYSHLAVVTQSGTYTVPEECKGKIRVVVIGGGDGGEAGEAGQDGSAGPTYDSAVEAAQSGILSGEPGDGGAAGEAGSGGKVLIVTLDTKVGKKYSVSIGEGGAGAAVGETPGTGGETIFGAVSSAQGTTSTAGYAALIGDTLYATPGTAGIAGGRGQGVNPAFSDDGAKGERPTVSEGTESWQAGATAQSYTGAGKVSFGGTGGGAAVGSDGADGSRSALVEIPEAERPDKAVGGVGGKGATPRDAATGQLPGQGGQGGHGGGGGGGGGATYGTTAEEQSMTGGKGGSGGKGGDGAAGCVLIYY